MDNVAILFKGTLRLDFENDDEEAHYNAEVIRAILRPDELVLEFQGHDLDEGSYTGSCRLIRSGTSFDGGGDFRFSRSVTKATIKATATESSEQILLEGSWKDDRDPDSYDLQINLHRAPAKS